MIKKLFLFLFVLLLWGTNVFSQKLPMKLDDCKLWRTIDKIEISKDGRWIAYNYRMLYAESPDTVYLFNVKTGKTYIKAGISDFGFLAGGKLLKYNKKENKTTSDSIAKNLENSASAVYLFNLSDLREKKWTGGPFMVPIGQSNYAYYSTYGTKDKSDVTFVNLLTGRMQKINNGGNCTMSGKSSLMYTVKSGNSNILYQWLNGTSIRIGEIPYDVCQIGQPDASGKGILYCSSNPNNPYDTNVLCLFDIKRKKCNKILDYADIKGLPEGVKISSSSKLIGDYSKVLLYFEPSNYVQPTQNKNGADLELWIWNERLSPRRQSRSPGFKISNYDSYIWDIKGKKMTVLPTKGITSVSFSENVNNILGAIGVDATAWEKESDWKMTSNNDVYYIGLNGKKKMLASHGLFDINWSPDGKYILLYVPSSKSWNLVNMQTGEMTDITKGKVPYPLYDEDSDYPFEAGAYGVASWNTKVGTVTIYDRFDLWTLDLKGVKAPVCLTQGYGRKNNISLRLPDKDYSTPSTFYLVGIDRNSKSKGLYELNGGKVNKVVADSKYNLKIESFSADKKTFIWDKENYGEHNYWVADIHFAHPHRITDMNPQAKHISWGTSQLYSWTNYEGKKNEGILFLPEGYKNGKKYPMIVTFYERETQDLNHYRIPEYSSATIDIPWFVSNGYVVFAPDIFFKIGKPGESCYNAVVSGVEKLIKDGIADKEHIGLNGHSWGGYETAYLVTRTDIFKCASPCSAVTDMVADYLMLRGTGQPNMYFEEDAQGRLGKTLWEDPKMYIDNSPIYHADKIHTPLLIFHGAEDKSVQPYQGMALFFAMRRLGRPAWMLNYRNEGHQMGDETNCRDFTQRLIDFFDHYLKEKPMPQWMIPTEDNR